MPCTGITIELDELENTTAPVERERVAADAIIEARRSALESKLRASSFSSRELRWPMVTQRHYPLTVTNLIALRSEAWLVRGVAALHSTCRCVGTATEASIEALQRCPAGVEHWQRLDTLSKKTSGIYCVH